MAVIASRTTSSGIPFSVSFAITSERLTVPRTAPGMVLATSSPPGSSLSIARTAEASRTTLLTPGLLPPLLDQLVGQAPPRRNIRADQRLRPPDTLPGSEDAETPLFEHQDELIARVDTESFAVLRGNYEPATFAHSCHSLAHLPPQNNSTMRASSSLQDNGNRLRPILMATLALVAGMLPLALGTGPGAEERRAIARLRTSP